MQRFDVVVAGGGVNALACAHGAGTGRPAVYAWWNETLGGRRRRHPRGDAARLQARSVRLLARLDSLQSRLPRDQEGAGEAMASKYIWSEDRITGHPDRRGGPGIVIYRSIDKTVESIARYSEKDAARYRRVHDDFTLIRDGFLKAFFSPPAPPSLMAQAMERSREGLKRLREFSLSALSWVEQNFENDFVRAVMLNWALAPQILPEQEGAGQSFYIMIPAVHVFGQSIPRGGSQQLPLAMVRYIEAHGGSVITRRAGALVHHRGRRGARRGAGRRPRDSRAARGRLRARAQTDFPASSCRVNTSPTTSSRWSTATLRPHQHLPDSSRLDGAAALHNGADMSCLPVPPHRRFDAADDQAVRRDGAGHPAQRSIPVERLLDAHGSDPRARRASTR